MIKTLMLAIAIFVAMLIQPAAAIDVGDVFFVSNGTGNTVISIMKRSADSVDIIAQSLHVDFRQELGRICELFPICADPPP